MNENEYKVASKRMRFFISLICLLLPQKVKHWLLIKVLGYEIHSSAIIGLSLICPGHLIMKKKSWIGGLNVCKDGVELLSIGEYGRIGNLNWITAAPLGVKSYSDEVDRKPMLIVGNHSAITRRHLIDCTNLVKIGKYSTFAGFRSQILTHAVDLLDCKQASHPVLIGDYCFIGTNAILLPGASLPNYCVLGASATLTRSYDECYCLYGGVPAKKIKIFSKDMGYFNRKTGSVD